jgi:hypothetical protein
MGPEAAGVVGVGPVRGHNSPMLSPPGAGTTAKARI